MKQTLLQLVGLLVAASFLIAGDEAKNAVAPESFEFPAIETTASAVSENVWRGISVGDANVSADMTTRAEIFEDYTVSLSGLARATDTDGEEYIGSLSVEKMLLDEWLVGLSQTWYSRGFDRTGPSASELGLHVSRLVGPVNVGISQYVATAGDNEGYSELTALYSSDFDVLPLAIDFNAELGYLSERGRFSHTGVTVSTTIPFADGYAFQPFVGASLELSDTTGLFGNTGNQLYGGFQIKKTF